MPKKDDNTIYWQNEAKELHSKIEELEKKVEAVNMGYGLILTRIDDLKDFNKNRFDKIDKALQENYNKLRYRIK